MKFRLVTIPLCKRLLALQVKKCGIWWYICSGLKPKLSLFAFYADTISPFSSVTLTCTKHGEWSLDKNDKSQMIKYIKARV